MLPRVSAGYLSAYAPGGEIATGFSDQVELGRIGEIQQSSSVVMHIQIDGDERGTFRLEVEGRNTQQIRRPELVEWTSHNTRCLPSCDGRFVLAHDCRDAQDGTPRPLHYRVLMEPVGMNIFFLGRNRAEPGRQLPKRGRG